MRLIFNWRDSRTKKLAYAYLAQFPNECSSDWPAIGWRCCSRELQPSRKPQIRTRKASGQGYGDPAGATGTTACRHCRVSSAITIRDSQSLADRQLSRGSSKLSDDNPLPIHGAAPRRAAGLLRIWPDRSRRTVRSKYCIRQPTPAIQGESPSARRPHWR